MKKLTLILSMLIALVGFNANAAMYLVGNEPFGEGWDPSKGVEMLDSGSRESLHVNKPLLFEHWFDDGTTFVTVSD